jgi:hypothetical protein
MDVASGESQDGKRRAWMTWIAVGVVIAVVIGFLVMSDHAQPAAHVPSKHDGRLVRAAHFSPQPAAPQRLTMVGTSSPRFPNEFSSAGARDHSTDKYPYGAPTAPVSLFPDLRGMPPAAGKGWPAPQMSGGGAATPDGLFVQTNAKLGLDGPLDLTSIGRTHGNGAFRDATDFMGVDVWHNAQTNMFAASKPVFDHSYKLAGQNGDQRIWMMKARESKDNMEAFYPQALQSGLITIPEQLDILMNDPTI